MGPIGFLDTETTSLELPGLPEHDAEFDCRAWEVALLLPRHDGVVRRQWLIHQYDLNLDRADPEALRIGRFHERHPAGERYQPPAGPAPVLYREGQVWRAVAEETAGRTVMWGSNVGFDMVRIQYRMSLWGIKPTWHYHPMDVPSMVLGWLVAKGLPLPEQIKSDTLSLAVGVDPADFDRHTALGDCEWMWAVYQAIGSPCGETS
ncbi:hypothetical protein I0C86_41600 [Plantactinospora sp. S1510]|uniref:Exonuclease domain-containing protein n=1 Tax=Plantactinospora alkalitolerans TaxID=2789879 RepID=A0ABS0HA38_9ACTN|nr:hypothetical protein [Plantactinospora alkalitolerans]MBF9135349.1 hypothetical protein [Plantactinospora alkalitolerans]